MTEPDAKDAVKAAVKSGAWKTPVIVVGVLTLVLVVVALLQSGIWYAPV